MVSPCIRTSGLDQLSVNRSRDGWFLRHSTADCARISATAARMSESGQNRKSSMRANVFRYAPESGHRAMQSACPFRANNGSHGFPDFLFCEPRIATGALSSLSSLRLLQLSGASRDAGHPVWPRASPSSRPIPRVWSRGCARHIPGRRPVRHAAGPCRDMGARFRTPSHAHQPTSRAFRRKPIAGREFRPGHSRYRPQAHAHSHRGSSRHDTTCCSPP